MSSGLTHTDATSFTDSSPSPKTPEVKSSLFGDYGDRRKGGGKAMAKDQGVLKVGQQESVTHQSSLCQLGGGWKRSLQEVPTLGSQHKPLSQSLDGGAPKARPNESVLPVMSTKSLRTDFAKQTVWTDEASSIICFVHTEISWFALRSSNSSADSWFHLAGTSHILPYRYLERHGDLACECFIHRKGFFFCWLRRLQIKGKRFPI